MLYLSPLEIWRVFVYNDKVILKQKEAYMSDFIEFAICLIVTTLILVVPIFTIVYFMDKISCEATARALSFTPHYSIFTGCVVEKPNGNRVLLDQFRIVVISKKSE